MNVAHDIPFNISVTSTAPTDSNTTEIFNSVTTFGTGVFRTLNINRLIFEVEHSHLATVRVYRSSNHGTNWDQTRADIAIAAPAAGDINVVDIDTAPYMDVKIEWVNGGTTQTTWRPGLRAQQNRDPGV